MKVYVITRTLGGIVNCSFYHVNGGKPVSPLQRLRHVELHSPTGFECGYGGSGPADLAASILADFFSVTAQTVVRTWKKPIGRLSRSATRNKRAADAEKVIHLYQAFKFDVISKMQIERGGRLELIADEIVKWLCKKENEEKSAAEAAIEGQWSTDYREVPTCPACHKQYTLILIDNGFRCTRDAGGCGAFYSLDKLPKLYKRELERGDSGGCHDGQ